MEEIRSLFPPSTGPPKLIHSAALKTSRPMVAAFDYNPRENKDQNKQRDKLSTILLEAINLALQHLLLWGVSCLEYRDRDQHSQ